MDAEAICNFIAADLTAAGFEVIEPALSLTALPDWDQLPAAFVHPMKDRALGGNTLTAGGFRQSISEQFAVVVVCPIADLKTRRDQVAAALLGKLLPGRRYETEYAEGEVLDLNRTAIWWRDSYTTQIDRRTT